LEGLQHFAEKYPFKHHFLCFKTAVFPHLEPSRYLEDFHEGHGNLLFSGKGDLATRAAEIANNPISAFTLIWRFAQDLPFLLQQVVNQSGKLNFMECELKMIISHSSTYD
jgi:hypothetical protein